MITILFDFYNYYKMYKKNKGLKMPKLHRQKNGIYKCNNYSYRLPTIWKKSRCNNITSSTCEMCDEHCEC
jgi:hypothetical protein